MGENEDCVVPDTLNRIVSQCGELLQWGQTSLAQLAVDIRNGDPGLQGSSDEYKSDPEEEENEQKWIVFVFSGICILVIVVCLVLIIVTAIRRRRAASIRRVNEESARDRSGRRSSNRRRKGEKSPKQDNQQRESNYHYLPLSTVSEKSEGQEATATMASGSMQQTYLLSSHMMFSEASSVCLGGPENASIRNLEFENSQLEGSSKLYESSRQQPRKSEHCEKATGSSTEFYSLPLEGAISSTDFNSGSRQTTERLIMENSLEVVPDQQLQPGSGLLLSQPQASEPAQIIVEETKSPPHSGKDRASCDDIERSKSGESGQNKEYATHLQTESVLSSNQEASERFRSTSTQPEFGSVPDTRL